MPDPKDYHLSAEEYALILQGLGREPNHLEMGIFSAMWSEHCSYKHTRALFRQFPVSAPWLAQGPGENAGAVLIDPDWAVVFKVESHNHPSFVAPYDGAATGVGGLVRDVMAMGARPIGVLTLLRSGDPAAEDTRRMVEEIRRGAAEYARACGIADLGLDWRCHPSYQTNPLVNVLVLGLARRGRLTRSSAGEPGNRLLYYGLPTGPHGVDGAAFASKGMDEHTEAHPPAGDPLAGLELMLATLRLIESGLLVGIQDMGAAGLTCSSFEMTHKAGAGLRLDLSAVPSADRMSPYALMLSETQERMLVSVRPDQIEAAMALLKEYPRLQAALIGEITPGGRAVLLEGGQTAADLPVDLVVDGFARIAINDHPAYFTHQQESPLLQESAFNRVEVSLGRGEASGLEIGPAVFPSAGGAQIDLPELKKAVLLQTACNGAEIERDPYQCAFRLVQECCDRLRAQGARPLGLTDGLNFGSPERPEISWQISAALGGLSDACRENQIPVVGGNVSLFNETDDRPILGQLFVGVVGVKDA